MPLKFEVSNYKSIKNLSLDMPPFMVLVGPNGAGKTNVVRAMEFLSELLAQSAEPTRHATWGQIIRRENRPARNGIHIAASTGWVAGAQRILVGVWITLQGKVGEPDVVVTSEAVRLRTESGGALSVHRVGDKVVYDLAESDSDVLNWIVPAQGHELETHRALVAARLENQAAVFMTEPGLRVLNSFLGPVFRPLQQSCTVTRLRLDTTSLRSDARFNGEHGLGPSGEGLPVVVDRLRGRGATPAKAFLPVLAALQEVYPRIEDVVPEAFAQGRVTLNFREKGIKDPIPLDGISDGVLHALALLVALRQPGPGLLAIEEPENALHPWSVRRILERAQTPTRGRAQRQLLITTHSETVVNAVRDPKSLFIVESGKNGTTVVPATTKETALESILKESGQQLGDVWMGGTLGGVPEAS
jgi:hypothetical protein